VRWDKVSDANQVLATARDTSANVLILDLMLQGAVDCRSVEQLRSALPGLRSSSSAAWRQR